MIFFLHMSPKAEGGWSITSLTFTIIVCVELPRKERHVADAPERAELLNGISRPVWIAASTHPGEEAIVIDLHRRLRARWPRSAARMSRC